MIDKGDDFAPTARGPGIGLTVLTAAVVSLLVSAATTFAILATVVVQSTASVQSTGELIQSGHVEPPLSTLKGEVYYSIPFQGPPNLEISTTGMAPKLVEQRKDGFKYEGLTGGAFDWKARGVRGGSAPAAATAEGAP